MLPRMFQKCIAAVCATACAVGALSLSTLHAAADAARPVEVLALGDDCLAEIAGGSSAAEIMAAYFGGTSTNYAAVGTTSADLLSDLQSDAALRQDVAEADVILVSVGVNDLLDAVFYENPNLPDAASQTTLINLIRSMPTEKALDVVNYVLDTLPGTVSTINSNLQQVVSQIRRQNPQANVVVQTVNNPLAIDFNDADWLANISTNRQLATAELYFYLNACLEGGSYESSMLLDSTLTIPTGVNESIESLSGVSEADFYNAFVGADGETGMAFEITNFANLDMTFSPVGQVVLAAAAICADDRFTGGNGGALTEAYDAADPNHNLSAMRVSLYDTITDAAANTAVTYIRGDIDGDTRITIQDSFQTLVAYANRMAGNTLDFTPAQRCAADVDDDHDLTIQDAFSILIYYATESAGNTPSWN